MNWYVVYTKPKWEKKVAERLNRLGIESYCPLLKKESQWSDRKKVIEVPLFNSFFFVRLAEKDRNQIFEVPGAIRYLFWLGKPAIVKTNEIQAIKEWLSVPDVYDVVVESWQRGDRIVLENGPFKNQEALVKEVKGNSYILVLEALGCVLKVENKMI